MTPDRLTIPALIALLALSAPLAAQPASGKATPPRATRTSQAAPALRDNAALVYYSVWSMITPEDDRTLRELCGTQEYGKPLPAALSEVLTRNQAAVKRIIRAAGMQSCDFARDYSQGFNLLLPELARMRGLTRMLGADADRCLLEGKYDDAAERYAAMYGLARHAGQDRILISSLVAIAITSYPSGRLMEDNVAVRLTPSGRAKILAAIERLNGVEGFNIKGAIEGERQLALMGTVEKYEGADAGRRFADEVLTVAGPRSIEENEQSKKDIERIRQMDGTALRAEAAKLERFYADVLKAWDRADAAALLKEYSEAASKGEYGSLGVYLAPAFSKCYASQSKGAETLEKVSEALRKADAAAAGESPKPAKQRQ